jgi:chromate transport protein ChrA
MKQRLYHISPFIIAAVILLIVIVIGFVLLRHSGWEVLFLIFYLPVFFALLGIDWLIKLITDNTLYVWIIEIVLIITAYFWLPLPGLGVR